MTTEENLLMGAGRVRRHEFEESVTGIIETFPVLGQRRSQLAGTLSGGEQQMLSIARALIAKPDLLMLDEPSMGLAPMVVSEIMATLAELRDAGLAVLVAEQNARAVLPVADSAALMVRGRITVSGEPKAIEERLAADGYMGAASGPSDGE
jgi:branched-chain amino acid transport system ATP-binding protein